MAHVRNIDSVPRFFESDYHPETRTIYIGDTPGEDGGIDSQIVRNVIKSFHLMALTPERPITVYLNSFGGDWFNGMAIYDIIKNCPSEVTIYGVGAVMSIGSLILQAGDHRIVYPSTTLMVHDGQESFSDISQNVYNWAEYGKAARNRMYKIYAERTSKSVAFWRRKCVYDLILTADRALEFGLVDSILGE